MSKWDVMDVCMRIGAAASPAVLMAHCTDLHIALRNVNRKSVFLEDACSCVLRRLSKLHMHVGDEEEEDDEEGSDSGDGDNSTGMAKLQANGCEFVRPLIDELVDENQIETDEIRKQRGVLLAFILELLSLCEGDNSELLDMAMACGVDSHVLLAVPRCREVYSVATAVLIPECDEDEDDEMEALEDSMHEDPIDDEQLEAEDRSWILHRVAAPFGLSKWTKFVVGTDDSSAFPIWSTPGLHRLLVHHLLTAASFPMLSPSSVLFLGTPIVNEALSADKSEVRELGVSMLRKLTAGCDSDSLTYDPFVHEDSTNLKTFSDSCDELNRRDWIGPTIQLLTNAMVSFNDPQARTNAFHVLRMFLGVLKRADRFHILERMVLQCPYGNVQAVFVDILRADCVDDWNNTSTSSPQSPFQTSRLVQLMIKLTQQAVERDLANHATTLASCFSVIRFLCLRDKANRSTIHDVVTAGTIRKVLEKLRARLALHHQSRSPSSEDSHLWVLEAAFDTVADLFKLGG